MRSYLIETPVGAARSWVHPAAERARSSAARPTTLVLGHGAGGGIHARDLAALAGGLPPTGVCVVLVEQPWRVAGRRLAGPPAQLDAAWRAVLADPAVRATVGQDGRLVVGGRSAGARVACRTALEVGADAVVALAFPLHPPGRPERSRAEELLGAGVPVLVVQGERDPFGGPSEIPSGPQVAPVPFADHGFAVPRRADVTQEGALVVLVEAVTGFLDRLP